MESNYDSDIGNLAVSRVIKEDSKHGKDVFERWSGVTRRKIEAVAGENPKKDLSSRDLIAEKYPKSKEDINVPSMVPKDSNKVFEVYRQLAIKRVAMDGMTLEDYPGLADDKDVVMAAVKQNGEAFRFSSTRLRDDEDVFIAATQSTEKGWMANIYGTYRLRIKHGHVGNR